MTSRHVKQVCKKFIIIECVCAHIYIQTNGNDNQTTSIVTSFSEFEPTLIQSKNSILQDKIKLHRVCTEKK